jgi:hypothetical protein
MRPYRVFIARMLQCLKAPPENDRLNRRNTLKLARAPRICYSSFMDQNPSRADPVAEAFQGVSHAQGEARGAGWVAFFGVVVWLVVASSLVLLWPEAFTNR